MNPNTVWLHATVFHRVLKSATGTGDLPSKIHQLARDLPQPVQLLVQAPRSLPRTNPTPPGEEKKRKKQASIDRGSSRDHQLGMHRTSSGRIGKSSSQQDSPSFLASLVAVKNTPGDVTITKDNDETGTSSENKGQDTGGASSDSPTPRPDTNQLISFYTDPNGGHDLRGRTLSEILQFPNRELEHHHDYIQWLFPLPEASLYSWGAPKIDRATAHAFRTRVELRNRLRESLMRMASFYGFEVVLAFSSAGTHCSIQEGLDFQRKSGFWIRSFDHNHLRITRIIRCLRVLGLEGEAEEFYRAVVKAAAPTPGRNGGVSPKTLMFWRRAAKRPLQVPPEDEDCPEAEDNEEEDGSGSDGNELEDGLDGAELERPKDK